MKPNRQAIIMALAGLALRRPGWNSYLRGIAEQFNGGAMFDEIKRLNVDRPDGDITTPRITL
jgi:hypothetical protein